MARFTSEENAFGTIMRVRQISLQGLWFWGALNAGLTAVIVLALGASVLKLGDVWAPMIAFICFVAYLIFDPKAMYTKYDWAVQEAWKVRIAYLTKVEFGKTPDTQEIRDEVNHGLQPIIEILKLSNVIVVPRTKKASRT